MSGDSSLQARQAAEIDALLKRDLHLSLDRLAQFRVIVSTYNGHASKISTGLAELRAPQKTALENLKDGQKAALVSVLGVEGYSKYLALKQRQAQDRVSLIRTSAAEAESTMRK